jgi:quercetin dioxygenase-like cupin family protein
MTQLNRRSAVSLGFAATAAFVAAVPASAQTQPSDGITRQSWGKRESMIPGYKTISRDGSSTSRAQRLSIHRCPMTWSCHVPEGELRVKQSDGMEFLAKKGDVWTCKKGIAEDRENVGSTVAIMRIIDLLPG